MTDIKPKLDLNLKVQEIKKRAIENKKIFLSFLENFIIKDNKSINDFIASYIWKDENENYNNPNYTYWIDGGLSWFYWFNDNQKYSDEHRASMMMSYFRVNYTIINETIWKDKTKRLFYLAKEIQDLLETKGIKTKIELTNFKYNITTDDFEFTYDLNSLFKEPSFNIKLVLDNSSTSGGSKGPIKAKLLKRRNLLQLKEKGKIKSSDYEERKQFIEKLDKTSNVLIPNLRKVIAVKPPEIPGILQLIKRMNNNIIVEFNLDYYHSIDSINRERKFDLDAFSKFYIEKSILRGYDPNENYQVVRQKLNRLTPLGLMTFSYLNTTKVENEMGLNVDKYRQNKFLEIELNNNKNKIELFYKKLLEIYIRLFSKFKSYNLFFIKKIKELIIKNSDVYYGDFMEYIEKWFVSKCRPAINTFILEMNEDLKPYNIKLFIAGGDAMRRYKNDISFTKDIDTKLYINNIDLPVGVTKEEMKKRIIDIIIKHIVKLRNYLEDNKDVIFSEVFNNSLKKLDNIKYKTTDNYYQVNIKLKESSRSQQFRTREIKQNPNFPVDLYSIDFKTSIYKYDHNNNLLNEDTHDISLLDVVLQDSDNYSDYYVEEFDEIPVASLEFILEDFEKTYSTDDRALARISSDKVLKDIKRYNEIYDIYKESKIRGINKEQQVVELSNTTIIESMKIINQLIKNTSIKNRLLGLLNKLLKKETFIIYDFIVIIYILKEGESELRKIPILNKLFNELVFFKRNMFNERLNLTDRDYISYKSEESPSLVSRNYEELFYAFCNSNDNMLRHVVPFYNNKIVATYNQLFKDSKPRMSLAVKQIQTKIKTKRKISSSSSSSSLSPPPPRPVPIIKKKSTVRKVPKSPIPSPPLSPDYSPPPMPSRPPLPNYSPPPMPRLRKRNRTVVSRK